MQTAVWSPVSMSDRWTTKSLGLYVNDESFHSS